MSLDHYNLVKAITFTPNGDELVVVPGADGERLAFGNQGAAFLIDKSVIFERDFAAVRSVSTGSGADAAFKSAYDSWQNVLFSIFGKGSIRDLISIRDSGRFVFGDGKVVDGRLYNTWCATAVRAALMADGVVVETDQRVADPFGFGAALAPLKPFAWAAGLVAIAIIVKAVD